MDIKTQKMLADVIVNAKEKTVAPYSTTAEVKSIVDDTVYVKIPGSENATPVKASSVSVKVGDIVDLVVSHADTHITGNRSDVAVSSTTAEGITKTMEASRLEMENELDIVGNKMKILNNNIDMQNNTINMQNNTITQMGNTIDQQNNTITQINNTIDQQGNTITQLNDTVTSQGNTITQINSTIETLDSTVETQGSAIQTLDSSIKIVNSAFIIQNGKLTGISEIMTNLLDSDYVTTDLLNADVAWIENGKIKQGAIGTVEIADSSITTAKIAELSADVITTGTLKTECLILTTDEVDPETGEKKVALITALNAKTKAGEGNILDGAVIKDETIEAAKITVVDLNAFGATIGNFHIGTSSMYNNKTSLNDPTNGVYIGTDGIALGQGSLLNMTDDSPFRVESDGDFHLGGKDNNYVNFDAFNGKLDIKADSIKMGSSNVASESYVDQKADGITTTVEGVNERLTTMEQNADGFTWSIDQTAIVSSVNEYYRSTSATSLSGGSWSENTPTWTQGTYIWLRIKNTNGKGTVSYSKPVCITGNTGAQGAKGDTGEQGPQGEKGDTGEQGIPGTNGSNGKTSYLHIKYSNDGGSTFTANSGETVGTYIGTCVDYNSADPTTVGSYTWAKIKGEQGATGADGRGISSTAVTYQAGSSGTTVPTGTWSSSVPSVSAGQYLWTKTVTTYTSGNPTTAYSVGRMGTNGQNGTDGTNGTDGKGIKSTAITYQAWSSGTTTPTGTWSTSVPSTTADKPYLWTKTVITYTDNTTSTSYSVGSTPEGIVVGGRNLILHSDKWTSSGSGASGITPSRENDMLKIVVASGNSNWHRFYADNVIEANLNDGDPFTFSIEIKSADGTVPPDIYFKSGMGYFKMTGSVSSEFSWVYYTGTWKKANDIAFYFGWSARVGTYYIRKIKLEKGNKATDWTPAPEDIEQAIEDVEVGGQNLLSDTNIPSMTKKTGPGNKYLSDSGNSSYSTGAFVEVANLPVPGFTHVYRFTCTTASSTATAGRSLCFYSGAVVPMIDGEEYTMSMYARKTSGNGKIRFMVGYEKYPYYGNFIEVTNTWKRYSYTFTYSDSATGGSGGARAYFGASCAVVGVVETFGYKLEKGNKATDWSLSVEAGKTATNYMNFSTDGLVVGDMTASTLGKNVLIDSDSVDIRNGSTVLASYGENISLYKDGIEAFTIKDSELLKTATDLNRTFTKTSYTTSGSTVTHVVGTGGGLTISAGTTYKWKFAIGSKNKYVVIVPTTSYSSVTQLTWVAEETNVLYLGRSGGNEATVTTPCVYLDENAVVDLSLNGSVWINNSGDLHGTAKGLPPLSIGANGGEHLEIDSNEITAKSNDTTPSHLYLNMEGGNVSVNNNCTRSLMFQDGAIYARNTSDNVPAGVRNKWIGVVDGVNESGNTTFGYGNYINNAGDTNIYGSALNLISRVIKLKDGDTVVLNTQNGANNIEASRSIQVANGKSYFGTSTSGDIRNNFQPCNTNNNCVIGYGSYSAKEGATNIYGEHLSLTTNLSYIMNNKAMVIPTISVYSVTTQTLKTSAAQIAVGSFNSTKNQTTIGSTYFKSTNGGVKCLLSGWVKVSAQLSLTGLTDGDGIYLYIYKNSTNMCFTYTRLNTSGEISIIDHVFKVAADDMIYIYGRNISAARGTINNNWYGASLTITYVN